jgi:hypothetical protein
VPFDDVYLVSDRLKLVPSKEIDAFEKRIGFPLPFGYREYLTTLGMGIFCEQLDVQRPSQIERELKYWQKEFVPIAVEEGFWDNGALLTADELSKTVFFATNSEGDKFVACPSKGRVVFELPRHDSKMRLLKKGFLKPFDCAYGARTRFRFPFFKPDNNRDRMAQLILKAGVDPMEVWGLVKKTWGKSMRVVEGDPRTSDQTIAFIKSIQGGVKLEGGYDTPWFYFEYDVDHRKEVHQVLRRLKPLVETPGGDWPEN